MLFGWSGCGYFLCVCVPAHAKAVRGVAIDALTMEVYTGSADRTVKVQTQSL